MHAEGRLFYRMTLTQRVQHLLITVTFSIQVLTGLPLKFAGYPWTQPLINLFGGVFMAGRIHRTSGLLMLLSFIYTSIYLVITTAQKCRILFRERPPENLMDGLVKVGLVIYNLPCFPTAKDGKDVVDFFKYATFPSKYKKPDYDKFCWKEKFDYLAVFWGVPVFTATGLMMWFPAFFTNLGLPPVFLNAALVIHTYETVLAAAVIFIWHFYNVIFAPEKFPMDNMVLTGVISEEHMLEEHSYEYRRIMTEEGPDSPSIVRDKHYHR